MSSDGNGLIACFSKFYDVGAGVRQACVQGGGGFAYILFLTSSASYKIDYPSGFAVDVVIDGVLFVRGSTGESVPLLHIFTNNALSGCTLERI